MLVNFIEEFITIWTIKTSLFDIGLFTKEGRHVAKILKESGFTKATLVLKTGDGNNLVDEIYEGKNDSAGFFIHDFEKTSDLENGNTY